ncbi:MAG: NPCBM/NEW2 domain-containing protein [Verrucomicrobiales bacterium]|nr:NPCBM/NEW2 domain-containing protein [Verrucomicrobiales bacterium]
MEPKSDIHYDPVPSARNHGYFLRALAARRALTFLEQQPEVDGSRLGVDGFSMGGVITFLTAATDDRVKAASPWWAPPLVLDGSLKGRTINTNAYAEHIKCPLLIMAPSNDFHGKVEDVAWMVDRISSKEVRIARSVHYNHKNDASSMAARELWFDAKLKDGYSFPAQPEFTVKLDSADGLPKVSVRPDDSMPISHVDIFYTRDAKLTSYTDNRTRYWQYARPEQADGVYSASLSLFDVEEPVWIFANVYYALDNSGEPRSVTLPTDTFTVTTRLRMLSAEDLAKAGVRKDSKTSSIIESFNDGWEKEWLVSDNKWQTLKLNQPRVPVPEYGKLVLDVQSDEANHLTIKVGGYRGIYQLKGDAAPQKIEIHPFDLEDPKTKAKLLSWSSLKRPMISLSASRRKAAPAFKKLAWEVIAEEEFMAARPFQLGGAVKQDGKVKLTFSLADRIDGRYDAEAKSVKVHDLNAGIDVTNGLQVHSQGVSEVDYFLNKKFTTFSATLIPCYQASAVFEVHGDGKKLFESQIFRGKTPPEDIEVDVSGVQMLKLVISEGGNGWGGDWVIWGNAAVK